MGEIIDGKQVAANIQHELKNKVALLSSAPCLAMVLVGNHPPSQIYVRRKAEACERTGMRSIRRELPEQITEIELLNEITLLNNDPAINGILIQLPLPGHINPYSIVCHLSPEKDVDGLHPINAGKLLLGNTDGFVPCTPLGIKVMLEKSGVDVAGKQVVIMGRSNLVGKPLAALLMQNSPGANATVTVVHSRSHHVNPITQSADILIVAMGKPLMVGAEMIKPGAVVVDVGINKIDNRIVGDVDFDAVKGKCSLITPVPGGVGPMTIMMLLSNTLKAAVNQMHVKKK